MFVTQQTYSGSYNYAPSAGEIILNAFQRIQVRPGEVLQNHLQQAVMELNLLLVKLSNQQPNLWTVGLEAIPLVAGTNTYSLPAETVMITNAYLRTVTGTATQDRLLFPISQTDYAALTNKNTQGFPSQYWYDRL